MGLVFVEWSTGPWLHVGSAVVGARLGWWWGQTSEDLGYWFERQRALYKRLPAWMHQVDESGESITDGSMQVARLAELRRAIIEADAAAFREAGDASAQAFLAELAGGAGAGAEDDLSGSSLRTSMAQVMEEIKEASVESRAQLRLALEACSRSAAVAHLSASRALTRAESQALVDDAATRAGTLAAQAARGAAEAAGKELSDADVAQIAKDAAERARRRAAGYVTLGDDADFVAAETVRTIDSERRRLQQVRAELLVHAAGAGVNLDSTETPAATAALASSLRRAVAEVDVALGSQALLNRAQRILTQRHLAVTQVQPVTHADSFLDAKCSARVIELWRAGSPARA